ncbi:MAG: aconitate hydratase AcnA, partial [Sediminispirochaetaceae bacterium]
MNIHSYREASSLKIRGKSYSYVSLRHLEETGHRIRELPVSIRILLENILRSFDGRRVTERDIETVLDWKHNQGRAEVPFSPGRVLMQDFTGVPAVVDLASFRAAASRRGRDPSGIQPQVPVDLVIDHSVQVDFYGSREAYAKNVGMEYRRNSERYAFLKWAGRSFEKFSVMPPGRGICHQVNLEYLSKVVCVRDGELAPDTFIGTDSHSTMANGLGVLGWGVGGIEAEAVLLGQPLRFTLPEVIGVELTGRLPAGATSTDLVLYVTELLRSVGVVGKFVEFFGPGAAGLSVPDRATIANMSPEFGSTAAFFPVDERTLEYLAATGRPEEQIRLVEAYSRANLLTLSGDQVPEYSRVLSIDLGKIMPSVAGPSRPQDRIPLERLKESVSSLVSEGKAGRDRAGLADGSVVIAAITSCTNTSNPAVMIAAGLLARNAVERGLQVPPWVKTSFAPGSLVVTEYLESSGLMEYLERLGFYLAGYGCTTCIGNSGPLDPDIVEQIRGRGVRTAAVLSGNRNFPARIHPDVAWNYLASPPLVVAFALAGRVGIDLTGETLGQDKEGRPVYLRDIWPDEEEIRSLEGDHLSADLFRRSYADMYGHDERWEELSAPEGLLFPWNEGSEYIRELPIFKKPLSGSQDVDREVLPIEGARVLLLLGDSVTTDHISPAGVFGEDTPAGSYLLEKGTVPEDFNTYGSRRGNHEVMMRGTFANVRIENRLSDRQGGYTMLFAGGKSPGGSTGGEPEENAADESPRSRITTVWEAAEAYRERGVPLIV